VWKAGPEAVPGFDVGFVSSWGVFFLVLEGEEGEDVFCLLGIFFLGLFLLLVVLLVVVLVVF